MSNNEERVLGWDDEIQNDGSTFTVLPAGDYPFEIIDLKRGQHQAKPDGKIPNCPKATVKIRVYSPEGQTVDIDHNLYLHSRCEGILCSFFKAIGQRKHGEPLRPDWSRVVGSRGGCKVTVRKWVGKNGNPGESNDIKAFLDPEKAPPMPTNDVPFDVPGEGGF